MAKSIEDFKNIQELTQMCNDSKEPSIIAKNELGKLIIMPLVEYEKQAYEKELYEGLLRAEQDYKNGRVKDADLVFDGLEAKYGQIKA